ncbi:PREDICTED: solute carrier organic anion transporter family member 6A1 [Dipodomys ordii]|uniref:Solute carrier organic anion transporter family member 6A1 n=1 Tax=Dipodomys ordii TaxID=10020 RepID=A0A1S3FLN2_DIPOR|nr:PREDICTED: solute carrier organic anion transporter family member 6A1 [Dipodomys ordii]
MKQALLEGRSEAKPPSSPKTLSALVMQARTMKLTAPAQEGWPMKKLSLVPQEDRPSPSALSWDERSIRTQSVISTEEKASDKALNPLYLTVIPAAMMKFSRFQKKKQAETELAEGQPVGTEEKAKVIDDTCGLACIVIPWCQQFNNVYSFLVLYCILVLAQGTVFGLVDLSNANFHKEYEVRTWQKLTLTLTYDVTSCLAALFIAYYGGKGNRARWIACSSFLIGFGSFLFAVPYFSAKIHRSMLEIEDICQENKNINFCPRSGTVFQIKYLVCFILGQMVQGIAGMALYILGMTLLDDNVSTYSSGIYLGIGDASEILGYGLGFTVGAPHLKTNNNTLMQSSTYYESDQPIKWYSTWWMDFLLVSAVAWSTFIPLSCFPTVMLGSEKIKAEKKKENTLIYTKDKESEANIKDLFVSVWGLMKNPLFMCQTLCKSIEAIIIIGASKFLPVYIENQFILTPRMATLLTGVILIPGGSIGHFLGGFIVSKLKLSCKGLLRFVMLTSAVSAACLSLVIFVHCDPDKVAGINENYDGTGEVGNLTAPCNAHCRCSAMVYFSVCGRDDVEYFSPCFAGCKRSKVLNREKAYYNCSCIKNGLLNSDIEGDFIDALPGKCDTKCYKLPLFFAFIFSAIIFSCFSSIPLNLIIFRKQTQRKASQYFLMCLLAQRRGCTQTPSWGEEKTHATFLLAKQVSPLRIIVEPGSVPQRTIPGPLIFEWTIRSSCTFRDANICGHKGRCWIYNKMKMASIWVGICFFCKLYTILLSGIGLHLMNRFKKESIDDLSLQLEEELGEFPKFFSRTSVGLDAWFFVTGLLTAIARVCVILE